MQRVGPGRLGWDGVTISFFLFTIPQCPFPIDDSRFTGSHRSPFTVHCSLFPVPRSPISIRHKITMPIKKENGVVWHHATVTRGRREVLNRHRSVVVWFTGLSGAGKSTIAHETEERLHRLGCRTYVFDGDNVRHGLCSDLGFSVEDRRENIRRIGEMVKLSIDAGVIALTAFISPFRSDREWVRSLVGKDDFIEIYCRCPVEVCKTRDVKGFYEKARRGEIANYTGVSSPYEEPLQPDLMLDTHMLSLEDCVAQVVSLLGRREIFTDAQGSA